MRSAYDFFYKYHLSRPTNPNKRIVDGWDDMPRDVEQWTAFSLRPWRLIGFFAYCLTVLDADEEVSLLSSQSSNVAEDSAKEMQKKKPITDPYD